MTEQLQRARMSAATGAPAFAAAVKYLGECGETRLSFGLRPKRLPRRRTRDFGMTARVPVSAWPFRPSRSGQRLEAEANRPGSLATPAEKPHAPQVSGSVSVGQAWRPSPP